MHILGHARCGKLSAGNGIDYRRYRIRLLAVTTSFHVLVSLSFYRIPIPRRSWGFLAYLFACLVVVCLVVHSEFGGI